MPEEICNGLASGGDGLTDAAREQLAKMNIDLAIADCKTKLNIAVTPECAAEAILGESVAGALGAPPCVK